MGTRVASSAAVIVLSAVLASCSGGPGTSTATTTVVDWITAAPNRPLVTPSASPPASPPSSPPPSPPPGPPPTAPIDWGSPAYTDNFDGTALSSSWIVYKNADVKPPVPKRTANSVRVRGGCLQLIGHRDKRYGYVGGGVANRIVLTYGRWEVRFRADAGAGYAPVVLLWPEGQWPLDGEVDLIEIFNGPRRGANEFLHLGANNRFIGKRIPRTVNFTKWHTMAVDWLPDHITYWLDGKALWTVERNIGDANYVPSTPFRLTLQNDAGCTGLCKPNKKTPAHVIMYVDWVKIYTVPPDVLKKYA